MPMKHVAILKSHLAAGGGLEKYTLRLAQAFAKKGCRVSILTSKKCTEVESSQSFNIIKLPATSKIGFRHLWQYDQLCQQWIKDQAPDIIFGMDRNTNQSHYRAGNGVHAEYLQKRCKTDSFLKQLTYSINPLHRSILKIEKSAYENPNLEVLFTNSSMVQEEILKHYQVDPNKIKVVHNGVEWHDMQPAFAEWPSQQAQILQNLGLDPSAFQFLFIGKGFRRKGLAYLLKALSHLKERHVQLSVVGEDKKIRAFKAMAESLGIQQRVKFFGHRNDVIKFYQACDVLTIPSTYDPFANVTIEALAMGLFVVSSKTNGGSEILTPSTGIVIENLFSEESVLAALQEALKHSKTPISARKIRDSVMSMDFDQQLIKIVDTTLLDPR